MSPPEGFTFAVRSNGDVVITHRGRSASTLRGDAARRLRKRLEGAADLEVQHVLARATGNYRRGNERG